MLYSPADRFFISSATSVVFAESSFISVFEELSFPPVGVVICSSSSEPPLEPSEQPVNVNVMLSARMQAKIQWGG